MKWKTRLGDENRRGRAVVIGGGVAGLLAARALSEHYGEVVIVDRDVPGGGAAARRGVPQGQHTHALTARGTQLLEGFFPGIVEEVRRRDVAVGDLQADAEWHFGPGSLAHGHADAPVLSCTRPLLESVIRERTLAAANVSWRAPARARGLALDAAGDTVVGVRLEAEGEPEEVLRADLVVDAAGRGSRLPAWLEEAGYAAPREIGSDVRVGYATVTCRVSPEARRGRLAAIASGSPECPRGGVAQVIEGGRVIISLAGFGEHAPTATLEGMMAHAESLASPTLAQWLKAAEDVGPVARYRVNRTYWRRYDRLRDLPRGVVAVGDSVCAFNPVYAQGMTVAAMQAVTLGECLSRGDRALGPRFHRRAARVIAGVWEMASSGDRGILEHAASGRRRPTLVERWVARVQLAGSRDPEIARRFLRVVGLLDSPAALLSPGLVLRVLAQRAPHRAGPRALSAPAART